MKVRIGSKTYECEKFGPSEFADLIEWLQERREDRIIKRAHKVYGDELPDKIFDEINKELGIDDMEDAIAADINAMCYLIYLAIRKTHPDITEENIKENVSTFDEASDVIGQLSPKTVAKKKKVRKKRKSKKR